MQTMVTTGNLVEITKTYSEAWRFFKKHWQIVYKVGLLYAVLTYAPQITLDAIIAAFDQNETFLSGVLYIVLTVWQTIIGMGATIIFLKVIRTKGDEIVTFEDFFSQKHRFWKYLWAALRYFLIVFLGLLLFIIPGIIWSIKYGLAFFLLLDKELGVKNSFDVSSQMTAGVKWQIFLFHLFGFLVLIGGVLMLGVGVFIAYPVVILASYMLYDKLLVRTKLGMAG